MNKLVVGLIVVGTVAAVGYMMYGKKSPKSEGKPEDFDDAELAMDEDKPKTDKFGAPVSSVLPKAKAKAKAKAKQEAALRSKLPKKDVLFANNPFYRSRFSGKERVSFNF